MWFSLSLSLSSSGLSIFPVVCLLCVPFCLSLRVVADVWERDVWDFQARSGSSGSCRLFLHFLGKIAVQEMSGRTPGSPRHPSSRHPRPSDLSLSRSISLLSSRFLSISPNLCCFIFYLFSSSLCFSLYSFEPFFLFRNHVLFLRLCPLWQTDYHNHGLSLSLSFFIEICIFKRTFNTR